MTRALVLGATGHIGAHVVRALLAKGYAVRAAYRNPRYLGVLEGLRVEHIPLDLEDPHQLRTALNGCELVFHCAGYYPRFTERRAQAITRGLEQVRRVFDVLRRHRLARVVYTSSAATIAPASDRPATEADQEPWPLTHWRPLYATVKIAMEHEVIRYHQAGLPIVMVNPSFCVGEYDAHPFSGRLLLLFAKQRLPVYLAHQFNAVYTGDVGQGCVLAAERGHPGQRYLLAAHQVTLQELGRLVAKEVGVSPPRWNVPYPLAMVAAVMTELLAMVTRTEPLLPRRALHTIRTRQWLDGSKADRELGVPHTPLEEAIHRALAWFKQHGYL